MREIVWDLYAVGDFIRQHGQRFARLHEPRGWKQVLRNEFKTVAGKCFRNSLFSAVHSDKNLYYCEGFARLPNTSVWYAHAWNSPVYVTKPLAIDLTWPFTSKYTDGKNVEYEGLVFDAQHVLDFFRYLECRGISNATLSVFKYLDYYKEFIAGVH